MVYSVLCVAIVLSTLMLQHQSETVCVCMTLISTYTKKKNASKMSFHSQSLTKPT